MSYVFNVLELIKPNSLPRTKADDSTINVILTNLFILIGAIAFLMLVVAGFRYIAARGQPDKTVQARNMILYSIIGIIIAALASTIVNLIVERAS